MELDVGFVIRVRLLWLVVKKGKGVTFTFPQPSHTMPHGLVINGPFADLQTHASHQFAPSSHLQVRKEVVRGVTAIRHVLASQILLFRSPELAQFSEWRISRDEKQPTTLIVIVQRKVDGVHVALHVHSAHCREVVGCSRHDGP